jgi:hypothetical protein
MYAAVRGFRRRWAILGFATATAVVGCTASSSPQVIYVTPPPTPVIIYVTITPAPTPTPEATPSPMATPAATPIPTPSPIPTSRAAACTGTAENKAFFAEAAAKLKFAVYCAVLPKGWWVKEGEYNSASGGRLTVAYTNKAGDKIAVDEGAWCTTGKATCGGPFVVGTAPFDGLAGELLQLGPNWVVTVNLGATPAYSIAGYGVTKAQILAYAAAMVRVPRS